MRLVNVNICIYTEIILKAFLHVKQSFHFY